MKSAGFSRLRTLARQLFPAWSRHARARWVVAKMKLTTAQPRAPISTLWANDMRAYRFMRIFRKDALP